MMKSIIPILFGLLASLSAADVSPSLAHASVWNEIWPDEEGKAQTRKVQGKIWNEAIQAALDKDNVAHLPKHEEPYYLEGPIILKSGQKLTADPDAELRLKPGCNTCLVRNEHIFGFADQPVPADTNPDTDITIEGGIWTTLANGLKDSNGNQRGASAKKDPVPGTHGVILLQNVRRVIVRNITVRQSRAFAVHLANVSDFTVDGVTLDRHGRDGVHVNAPASHGFIRRVSGVSHDDTIALNAWEWKNYAPSFGAIHHIIIEEIHGSPVDVPSANSIRLLPGVKRFSDGSTLDCPIHDITVRHITDIRDFKFYDQPNLEIGRDRDASAGIGALRSIALEHITFSRPGSIQVHANTDGLTVRDAKLSFAPAAGYHLIEIGPQSQTYKRQSDDPATWTEIFSPDHDCIVRNLSVSGVRFQDAATDLPVTQVVHVIELKPNPDYPRTTPQGGAGKGIWIR